MRRNADGQRASKKVVSNGVTTTTYYVGNWLEVSEGVTTTYYYLGGQRVAMRRVPLQGEQQVTYLHSDHLGSTSAWSGSNSGSQTYYPFGLVRTTTGTLPTDATFTGQRVDRSTAQNTAGTDGLLYYGARYYDAYRNRWAQPDTIVPDGNDPQSLNRYTYTRDNPVKYTDPTGHDEFIIPGLQAEHDYKDPASWQDWIKAHIGEEKYAAWYKAWTDAETSEAKTRVAHEYGVAVFDWGSWSANRTRSAYDAAKDVQKQIDAYGLKDVTIVGHSKGASTLMALLAEYQTGLVDKGQVKNAVIIDPPKFLGGGSAMRWLDAPPIMTAKGTGVQVAVLPGLASCVTFACQGPVADATVYRYAGTHELRGNYADDVFYGLDIKQDAHAQPRPPLRGTGTNY